MTALFNWLEDHISLGRAVGEQAQQDQEILTQMLHSLLALSDLRRVDFSEAVKEAGRRYADAAERIDGSRTGKV